MEAVVLLLLVAFIIGFVLVVLGKKTLKNIAIYVASAIIAIILFVLYLLSSR